MLALRPREGDILARGDEWARLTWGGRSLTSRRSPDLGVPDQSRDMLHKNNFETAFSCLGSLDECSWIDIAVRA